MKQDGVQAVRYEKRQVGMEEEEKMETRQVSKVVDWEKEEREGEE